jgi:hypothetical protein
MERGHHQLRRALSAVSRAVIAKLRPVLSVTTRARKRE